MRRGLRRSLLKMLGLLVMLRMLRTNIIHIMLLIVMLIMIPMMLCGMKVMNYLLIMTSWLWLRLRVLLCELNLNHSTGCGIIDHVNSWARVVVLRPLWMVQRGLLVPRVRGGVMRLLSWISRMMLPCIGWS